MDAQALMAIRQEALAGAVDLAPALSELRRAADKALQVGPFSVVNKTGTPPDGDRHQYMSLGSYWWPNPDTLGGLPYVRRDGQRNPEGNSPYYDDLALSRMVNAVDTLALAYYLTGTQTYADHAARLVQAWFLDESTRMNPNMHYAQIIPGRPQERGGGIIDSRVFMRVVDAVGLLAGSPSWTVGDQEALQAWFGQLLGWLRESPQGQMESRATNNHGSWYDAQVVCYALFTGQGDIAAQVVARSTKARIASQVAPDGRQPNELTRTRSFDYSTFNLEALFQLATLGDHAGVDLWRYQTADTRSIRRALDFLVPYIGGATPWPYPEIASINFFAEMAPLLARAAKAYPDGSYEQVLAQLVKGQKALPLLKLHLGAWKLE